LKYANQCLAFSEWGTSNAAHGGASYSVRRVAAGAFMRLRPCAQAGTTGEPGSGDLDRLRPDLLRGGPTATIRSTALDVRLVNFSDNSVMAGAVQSGEIDATTLTYDQVHCLQTRRGWKLKVVHGRLTIRWGGRRHTREHADQEHQGIEGPQGGLHVGIAVGLPIELPALAKDGMTEKGRRTRQYHARRCGRHHGRRFDRSRREL